MTMNAEKLLPQAVEAEAGLLGAILIGGGAVVAEVAHQITPEDFYREAHRELYCVAYDLWQAGKDVDLLTISTEIERRNLTDAVGGISYVSSLTNHVPTSLHARSYVQDVARTALLRSLIQAAGQIAGIAYNEPDADQAIESAHAILTDATIRHGSHDSVTMSQALDAFLGECDDAMQGAYPPGVLTGFRDLDHHLGGFRPGELVYLCGRPGSGKSAYAAAIAVSAAIELQARREQGEEGGAVEWVSYEMTHSQQVKRLITAWAGIDGRAIRAGFRFPDGSLDLGTRRHVDEAAHAIRAAYGQTLRLYDRRQTLSQLKQHLTTAAYRRGLRLAVIDYLGLIDVESDQQRKSEYERITLFSREIKALAMDLRIPILCLVQLNRDCEKRTNKRPQLADLRSSGGLEQDADFVLGVYRGAMYNAPQAKVDERFRQFGELLTLKARDGVRGVTIPTRFEAEYTRPSDWPSEWEYKTYLTINASEEWQAEGGAE